MDSPFQLADYPELRNYFKLQILLHKKVLPLLRVKFVEEWFNVASNEWDNSLSSGVYFTELFGKSENFKNATYIQRSYMDKGDINKWDLSLLAMALKAMSGATDGYSADRNVNADKNRYWKSLDTLIRIRNELSHLADLEINDSDFSKKKSQIESAIASQDFQVAQNMMRFQDTNTNKNRVENIMDSSYTNRQQGSHPITGLPQSQGQITQPRNPPPRRSSLKCIIM